MRSAQLITYGIDDETAEALQAVVRDRGVAVRIARHPKACANLLRQAGAGVLLLRVGKNLVEEFTLLSQTVETFPHVAPVVWGEADHPRLAGLAWDLGAGFVPVRKPKKLPAETAKVTYELEYGSDTLEVHKDAIQAGQRVIIVDDLLATGGTASATVQLVKSLGGEIAGLGFVVELDFLKGRQRLEDYDVFSLLHYDT